MSYKLNSAIAVIDIGKNSFHVVGHDKRGCLYRKSDSAIMVMKPAEDRRRYDAAHVLDGEMERSVFVERPMCPQLVVIGGILRQNPA